MSAEPAPGRRPAAQPRPHRGTLRALREGLSEAEWVQLTEEAEEALAGALLQPEPDLQPLLDVIEAWYRTMIVRQDPGYQEAVARYAGKSADELGERVYTAEDLQRYLGTSTGAGTQRTSRWPCGSPACSAFRSTTYSSTRTPPR